MKAGHQHFLQYRAFFENELMESWQSKRYLGHYVTTNICAKEPFRAPDFTYHAPLGSLRECPVSCRWVQFRARHPPVGFCGIHIACFQQAIICNTTNVSCLMRHEIEPQGLCLHNVNNIKGLRGGGGFNFNNNNNEMFANTSMSSYKVASPTSYRLD